MKTYWRNLTDWKTVKGKKGMEFKLIEVNIADKDNAIDIVNSLLQGGYNVLRFAYILASVNKELQNIVKDKVTCLIIRTDVEVNSKVLKHPNVKYIEQFYFLKNAKTYELLEIGINQGNLISFRVQGNPTIDDYYKILATYLCHDKVFVAFYDLQKPSNWYLTKISDTEVNIVPAALFGSGANQSRKAV